MSDRFRRASAASRPSAVRCPEPAGGRTCAQAGHDVISLGQAVPGFPPPASAIDAATPGAGDPDVHRYSADAGLSSLREASLRSTSRALTDRAIADDVIVTAGGNQAFMLAAITLLDPGDEVVLAAPYFVNHEMAIRAVGAVPIEACRLSEARDFRTRWMDIEPHITYAEPARWFCARRAIPPARSSPRDELDPESCSSCRASWDPWSSATKPTCTSSSTASTPAPPRREPGATTSSSSERSRSRSR